MVPFTVTFTVTVSFQSNFHVIQGKGINYIFNILHRNRKNIARRINIELWKKSVLRMYRLS